MEEKRKPAACNGLLRGILTGICVFGVTLSGCSSSNPETADTTGTETIAQSSSAEEISIEEHMEIYEKQGFSRKDAMKKVAKDRGVSKREIYQYLVQ